MLIINDDRRDYFLSSALSKAKAKEQMVDSVRDLQKVKITIPLGNPNLKLVHTNQFLFTELPEEVFELANFDAIATALNSTYGRYSGYVLNRWYIEGRTIDNDGKKATMELELNPFASPVLKFHDEKSSFEKAYTDATTNKTSNASTTSTKKKVRSVSKKVDIQKAINEVGHLMEKKKYKRYTYSDYNNFVKHGYGDCWAGAYFIACQLQKRGVTARIISYRTAYSNDHRSAQYKDKNGKWKNFPYKKFKIHSWFHAYASSGKVIPNNCPKKM